MPRVRLEEGLFEFMRVVMEELASDIQDGFAFTNYDEEWVSKVEEVSKLLEYTKHFKRFTVEIVPDAKCKGRDDT